SGEIDFIGRRSADKPVFIDNQDRGNYRLYDSISTSMNSVVLALNLTHPDPLKREVFNNKDFRAGLSHAIDRQEIIDLVFVAQGEPWQTSPPRESPFYNERLAKQYTEYDVELANEHLDRVLPERDAQGFRLGPDGQRFSFQFEAPSRVQDWVDTLELVSGYWREVGIDMQVRSMADALLGERKGSNLHDAVVWGGDGGLDALLEPRWYFPVGGESNFAIPWARWYSGAEGPREEPSAPAKQQMELYRQVQATADPEAQRELFGQILEIAADEFWVMGITLPTPGYGIVKNDFRNVPNTIISSWLYPTPGPTNPFQYFKEQ
ncbi:MAG: ABC transporter substrate-binding protein, partial [Deinococcota bacterium]|nr:ABC transporter substrate-binding protein [Deinococcota bacterium]